MQRGEIDMATPPLAILLRFTPLYTCQSKAILACQVGPYCEGIVDVQSILGDTTTDVVELTFRERIHFCREFADFRVVSHDPTSVCWPCMGTPYRPHKLCHANIAFAR